MEKQELKQLIKEILITENINDFLSYHDHNDGDPATSAAKIISLTEKYVKQVERALQLADHF